MIKCKPICIIPARGGSKRLPRKNIIKIGGKPVLAWTIEQAAESGLFGKIIVSTEDEEIASIAADCPAAEVWRRSNELASDRATVDQVCIDVLERLRLETNSQPEEFCCLYATAILRSVEDIVKCHGLLIELGCDTAMTVTDYEQYPHQAMKMSDKGRLVVQWPELLNTPRQQLPHFVVDAGSVYWLNTKEFLRNRNFYGGTINGYMVPHARAIDIDTPDDFEMLMYYWNKMEKVRK
jgi:pseudaminic acid cytidylyltransferase